MVKKTTARSKSLSRKDFNLTPTPEEKAESRIFVKRILEGKPIRIPNAHKERN